MADYLTPEKLENASKDCDSWDLFFHGTELEDVVTRLGKIFPTLSKILKLFFDNGLFRPFQTEAQLLSYVPAINPSAAYAFDTKKLYLWDGTSWTDEGTSPLDLAKKYTDSIITDSENNDFFTLVDSNGFKSLIINKGSINLPHLKIRDDQSIDDFIVHDPNGYIAFSSKQLLAKLNQLQSEIDNAQESIVTKLDSQALAYSQNVNNTVVTDVQKPVFDYNIVITYGQSLSTASEGWPALSKTAIEPSNVLMFGQAVRSLDYEAAEWRPVGSETLTGLKAVVQKRGQTDAVILTDSEVAALPAGDQNYGESFDIGATNFWRKMQNDYFGVASNPSKKIIVLNCGVEGRTIQQLSKDASPNLFSRMTIAANKVKTYIASINPNATVGLVAVLHAQGEYDYVTNTSKATFLSLTKQLRADIIADLAFSIFNQNKPPAFITYQTCAQWSDDSTNLAVANAQIEMSDTVSGCFLAAPDYHVTDKGGHLDSNGYRWLGMHFGQVLHRVLDRGLQWKPLKPLTAIRNGKEIYINFHVPKPPLQFKSIYEILIKKDFANKGFRLTKDGSEISISTVEIVGNCTVKITASTDIPEGAIIWYAPKTTYNGAGNLCDSDATIAAYNYEYQAGTGQYPEANLPELVNKPYPLNNFCTSFTLNLE